jgi:hypothetical protein
MRRKVFDILVSTTGLVMVIVLAAAGGLLMWASSFADSNVHDQLAQQQITFPPKSAFAHAKPGTEITPEMVPHLEKYAGQRLVTGAQAKAYANHFIAVHLSQMPYNGVYSKVSAAARAHPNDKQLQAEVDTVFRGTTLRGLLLEAYGFSVIGTIAFWGAIASFSLAFVMAVLVAFGFWHARRTPAAVELMVPPPSS